MVEVDVVVDQREMAGLPGGVRACRLVGERSERFLVALSRALDEEVDGCSVEIRSEGTSDRVLIPVDPQSSVQDVEAFTDGNPLLLSMVGRGGPSLPTLLDYVNVGLTVAGVADLLRRGHGAVEAVLWRRQRSAARRWIVAGTDSAPSMDLVQCVRAEPWWNLDELARNFGIDREQAATLLRKLDYVPRTPEGQYWTEQAPE
ncbi:hypothetical protein J2Y69_001390 [Microbacterium resistens]|uniref:Uncharacterized protein n=1 Tax=Microbacterium resistens TaxID=156977 RepID=A0ABU1SB01_9MICO|nr:hypothetical protein [Microbacterium resistens]MDR6866791.1 hypothetical protein [Microbacterium resistens]